jgi:hypothetical protein
MNLQKIAEAMREIADALEAERDPCMGAIQPAATQPAATQPAATQPAATQPAATQPATSADILDAQVFTTSMQTMAREVGSGVLHQWMPDIYNRYADGIQKYSAIKPENRQAVLDYVRDRIAAAKQAGGA